MSIHFSDLDRRIEIRAQLEVPWRLELLSGLYQNYQRLKNTITNEDNPILADCIRQLHLQIKVQLNILYGLTGLGLRGLINYYWNNQTRVPRNIMIMNANNIYNDFNDGNDSLFVPQSERTLADLRIISNNRFRTPASRIIEYHNTDGPVPHGEEENRVAIYRGLGSSNESITLDDTDAPPRVTFMTYQLSSTARYDYSFIA